MMVQQLMDTPFAAELLFSPYMLECTECKGIMYQMG